MSHIGAKTGELESLGKNKFSGQVHQDLIDSARRIHDTDLEVSIFGHGDVMGPKIVQAYDKTKNTLYDKVLETAEQVDSVGKALATIARHYDKVDTSYSH